MIYLPIIVWPLIRALFEALRDAIDFNKGSQSMGILWHALKFPQYASIFFLGVFSEFELSLRVLIIWLLALALGYAVFEFALKQWRKIPWQNYPWA